MCWCRTRNEWYRDAYLRATLVAVPDRDLASECTHSLANTGQATPTPKPRSGVVGKTGTVIDHRQGRPFTLRLEDDIYTPLCSVTDSVR